MPIITENQLEHIFPNTHNFGGLVDAFNHCFGKYSLNSVNRVAGFLSQAGHESAGFTVFVENLNYSASGLLGIFPKYFNAAQANQYARHPEMIANRVYANRMGNGNEASGDGWKFRGKGAIQITGRETITAYGVSLNLSVNDTLDYLNSMEGCIDSAGWFWSTHNLNRYADASDIEKLSIAVNGGRNGLDDRTAIWKRALTVLA